MIANVSALSAVALSSLMILHVGQTRKDVLRLEVRSVKVAGNDVIVACLLSRDDRSVVILKQYIKTRLVFFDQTDKETKEIRKTISLTEEFVAGQERTVEFTFRESLPATSCRLAIEIPMLQLRTKRIEIPANVSGHAK